MTRLLSASMATVVAWIAREMIHLGQNIIRTAYGWLSWSEKL